MKPIIHVEWDAMSIEEDREIVHKLTMFAIELGVKGLNVWGTMRPGAGGDGD